MGFTPDGDALYIADSLSSDTTELYVLGLDGKRWETLAHNPDVDLGPVMVHPTKHHIQAVGFELHRLGQWLGVDPSGFDTKMVFGSSIGNYRRGLSPQELGDVLREAGPTLERLGYLQDEPVIG